MKVIPVIDILNGKVVHAVRGKRKDYQPLQSVLSNSEKPLEVAKAFRSLGFSELYIADLDAILDCSINFEVFKRIAGETGLKLMVDGGVTGSERAQRLMGNGVSKLIIGTETLERKSFVREAVDLFGSDHVVVSLDLKGEKILTKPGVDDCCNATCLLREFKAMDASQVIILDLERVGSGEGVNTAFLEKAITEVGFSVYSGGGVRNLDDLIELRHLGAAGALVATALHSGTISVEELKQENFL